MLLLAPPGTATRELLHFAAATSAEATVGLAKITEEPTIVDDAVWDTLALADAHEGDEP